MRRLLVFLGLLLGVASLALAQTPNLNVLRMNGGISCAPNWPKNIPGLTLVEWIDASDATTITTVAGAVSQANDKSGTGFNVAQSTAGNRPVYSVGVQHGKNVFTFGSSTLGLGNAAATLLRGVSTWTIATAESQTSTTYNGFAVFVSAGSGSVRAGLEFNRTSVTTNSVYSVGRRNEGDAAAFASGGNTALFNS
jgi:hypothetical protein